MYVSQVALQSLFESLIEKADVSHNRVIGFCFTFSRKLAPVAERDFHWLPQNSHFIIRLLINVCFCLPHTWQTVPSIVDQQ